MNKKTAVPLIILFVAIAVALIYRLFIDYSIDLQLSNESIRVNMYDYVNLEDYIYKAFDNNGKDLRGKIKISIECDEEDQVKDNILYVKGLGPKVVTYTIQSRNKTVVKKLVIKVIIDPNEDGFNPNYENIESESELNNDDVPKDGGSSDLTKEQLDYLKSL